jgi:hypothetical protein
MIQLPDKACGCQQIYNDKGVPVYFCIATDPMKLDECCEDTECPLYQAILIDELP